MNFPLFRKRRRSRNRKPFTSKRRFTHERLEPRAMMTINLTGVDFMVNDVTPGFQGVDGNATSVAVSHTTGTLVAYSNEGVGTRESVQLGRFDFDGVLQEVVQVNTTVRGSRGAAVVVANDAGNSVVVWHGQGAGDKYGIFMQRFNADGTAEGDETLVNQTIGGTQFDPAVAMDSNGNFVVSWSGVSADDPTGIYARRFNADGTAVSDEIHVNSTSSNEQMQPAIAMSRNGQSVIIWTSRNQDGDTTGIFGQRFDAEGIAQGDEFQLNTTSAAQQQEPAVAMQDDGTFMAVWSSSGQGVDSWEIVGQLFDAEGNTVGDEVIVNTTTTDVQRNPQIAGARSKYLVTWQSGVVGDGSGWEVMSQDLDASGNRIGSETVVNSDLFGLNSGHQENPAAALNAAGRAAIVWSGQGTADNQGVFARNLIDVDATDENSQPVLVIPDQTISPDEELSVTITATDADAADTLTFALDSTVSPDGATITRSTDDPRMATISWTPDADADASTTVPFRVVVTDNGIGQLETSAEFSVEVTDGLLRLDLNGRNELGFDATAQFAIGLGPATIADETLFVQDANGLIGRASVVLSEAPDGAAEVLSVTIPDTITNITANYVSQNRTLTLVGNDTAANYEAVLRTLRYDNSAASTSGTRTVEVRVNDLGDLDDRFDGRLSNIATITVNFVMEDLAGLATAAVEAEAQFFGAAWSEATAQQRALFEDGGQLLPFTDVTNVDRTLNTDVATPNDIALDDLENPIWIFSDGTRIEGLLTPEELAAQLGIDIPQSADPTFVEIPDQTLLIGSPSHISLDGYDPTGGPLTYTVSTNRDDLVEASILEGNRSARVTVEGYGDMVFELFEQRADRATDRFIELASDDLFNDGEANNDFFYDDVIFHRIIDNFVIQGGDPTGTGSGGTGTDYDDQFHVDLQHNRTGLLSAAKSLEDTNDSQFFITEGSSSALRNLDFHHTIFGVLTEGEDVRAAISDTSVIRDQDDVNSGLISSSDRLLNRPGNPSTDEEFNITMSNVEIFEDAENAVLFLKASSDAAVGEVVEVTVTVTDAQGNSFDQTFSVILAADTFNGTPFLDDIESPVTIDSDSTAMIQLAASDAEGDDVEFGARLPREVVNGQLVVINQPDFDFTVDADTGEVTVTPTVGFTGTLLLEVQVGAVGIGSLETVSDSLVDRQVITIIVE